MRAAVPALGYLLGSLPFGYWITWIKAGVDIRTVGSGNTGSTNVGRVCGRRTGHLVFVLDAAKGTAPALIARALGLDVRWQILGAACAIIGHVYSVWLGFRGGKGVATAFGAFLGVAWITGLVGFAIYGLVLRCFRIVSLASVCAAASIPLLMICFYPNDRYRLALGAGAACLGIYKHRANIARIAAGTEPRVGATAGPAGE